MRNTYLSILGLPSTANDEQIKSTYRALCKKYHPDINKEIGANEKFIQIQQAYDYLTSKSQPYFFVDYVKRNRQILWQKLRRSEIKEKKEMDFKLNSFLKYTDIIMLMFTFLNLLFILDFLLPGEHSQDKLYNRYSKIIRSKKSSEAFSMILVFEHNQLKIESFEYIRNSDFLRKSMIDENAVFDIEKSRIFGIVKSAHIGNKTFKSYPNVLAILSLFALVVILSNALNLFVLTNPTHKIQLLIFIMFLSIIFYSVVFMMK